jgi:hypothetical protein
VTSVGDHEGAGLPHPAVIVGGEGEIRTPEALASLPVFKTGAFNRSATSPLKWNQSVTLILSGRRARFGHRQVAREAVPKVMEARLP